jgi:hypothetical protein
LLGLALVLASREAAAADPTAESQVLLGQAIESCENGSAEDYVKKRDIALKADRSVATWNGKLRGKWSPKEMLAKCDREMPLRAAKDKQDAAVRAQIVQVQKACDAAAELEPAKIAAYQKARAALVALGPTAMSMTTEEGAGPPGSFVVSECDKSLAKRITEKKQELAVQKEARAKQAAEEKTRQDAANRKAALIAALRGDRAATFKKLGQPDEVAPDGEGLRAARWEYSTSIGLGRSQAEVNGKTIDVDHSAVCTERFDFAGDKVVKHSFVGPGCKYR